MTKKKIPELKIEPIAGRGNLLYLSLIEYKREQYLCIVDTVKDTELGAYVLDYAEQEGIDLTSFLSVITYWFYAKSDNIPLSVELANHNLTAWAEPMYRTFDVAYISRIVGSVFDYKSPKKTKVRRRRVIAIPEGIAIKLKRE